MPYFKDFNKDIKDLLSKNYADNGAWKLESKFKGPEKTIFVNPQASSKGLSVDVEYNFKPYKTKVTVTDKVQVTPKVTYDKDGHKVEASVDKDLKYELVYEGKFGAVAVHDKITNALADAYVSYAIGAFSVGGGAAFSIEKSALKGWSAGVHYADKGIVGDVTTDSLKTYTCGLLFPLTIAGQKVNIALQTICGPATKTLGWSAGVETDCILVKGAKLRAKIDQSYKLALAWQTKLGDNWKVAIGAEPIDVKFGLTFTRE